MLNPTQITETLTTTTSTSTSTTTTTTSCYFFISTVYKYHISKKADGSNIKNALSNINFSHIKHMGIYLLFQYFFKSLLIPHK